MNVNRRTAIPPATVVMMAVVRMVVITVVIDMDAVGQPADGKGRSDAPEKTVMKLVVKIVTVRVRIVINGVGLRVIVVHGSRLIHDDALRLVVRDVDNVFLNGGDFDYTFGFSDILMFITAQIARSIGAVAE